MNAIIMGAATITSSLVLFVLAFLMDPLFGNEGGIYMALCSMVGIFLFSTKFPEKSQRCLAGV